MASHQPLIKGFVKAIVGALRCLHEQQWNTYIQFVNWHSVPKGAHIKDNDNDMWTTANLSNDTSSLQDSF